MNTAPQDDFSGDLARNLGGWSDDALLKELSRRTTMTTDADHELISTGAGIHLQHRRGPERQPISVTYDSTSSEFTITVTDMRWAYDNAGLPAEEKTDPTAQGTFETVAWTFSAGNGDVEIGYEPTYSPNVHEHANVTYSLKFVDHNSLATDSADASNRGGTGTFRRLAKVTLKGDGTYTIPYNITKPHVLVRPEPPATRSFCEYDDDTGTLNVYNLDDTGDGGLTASLAIPAPSGERIVCWGIKRGGGIELDFHDSINWLVTPLRVCRISVDSSGYLTYLKPYTERLQYARSPDLVVLEIIDHEAGAKTAEAHIWRGSYYYDATTTPATVNSPDTGTITAHVIQLHDDEILAPGRLFFGRRLVTGIVEIIPFTLQ